MLSSFWTGIIQATRNWQLVLILLAASLAVSIPVVIPIFLLITMTSSSTLAPYSLNAHKLDIVWLIDLFNERFSGFSLDSSALQVGIMLLVAAFFSVLLNVFFAGGIIEVLSDGYGRFSLRRFWAGSGSWFPRFFRLWLLSLIPYGAVFGAFVLVTRFINQWDTEAWREKPGDIASLVALGLLLLVFMIVNMIFDYARIGAVINQSHGQRRGMFRETLRSFRFSLRRFVGAFGLYLLVAILGIVVFVLIAALRSSFSQSSLIAALFAIFLGQIAMAARMWNRVTFYAAQIDYYRKYAPPPPIAEPVHPPPPPPEFMSATLDPVPE